MFTKEENKVINIVEGRGVAASEYDNVIREIGNYVSDYIKNNSPKTGEKLFVKNLNREFMFHIYKFCIPTEITKKIDWFKHLTISITVRDLKTREKISFLPDGSGEYHASTYDKIVDGKLNSGEIRVICYSYNGRLLPTTLYQTLYHELNHSYENFKKLSKNPFDIMSHSNVFNYDKLLRGLRDEDVAKKYFCEIAYRLLTPTEFNALVSGIYGELQGMDSKSYQADIKNTKTYQIYSDFKNVYLPVLDKMPAEKWKIFSEYYYNEPTDLNSLKNNFIKLVRFKLSDLFKRMGKTASLWYEKNRDMSEQKIIFDGEDINDEISFLKENFYNIFNNLKNKNNE